MAKKTSKKKVIRQKFRESVFKRDNHKCKICAHDAVDAHHITDRNDMPGGGYVLENGISLCGNCHVLAEIFHSTGTAAPDFSPEDLYNLINSSKDIAIEQSLKAR